MKFKILIILLVAQILSGCKKDFLDAKPNSNIVVPKKLAEFQTLLDNNIEMNSTGGLAQLSSDEYFVNSKINFDAFSREIFRNGYLWRADLYSGEMNIPDWNQNYRAIFYANSVISGVEINAPENSSEWTNLNGQAHFFRAYAYFDLARNFCAAYQNSTSESLPGLPLRLSPNIDEIKQRSTLKETFDQIFSDLDVAIRDINVEYQTTTRNRPSKAAAYALLARIYLYMGDFVNAGKCADACLKLYNRLINYNSISTTSATPFGYTTDETIFFSVQQGTYVNATGLTTQWTAIGVDPFLVSQYSTNDLRSSIFLAKNSVNNFNVKRGYVGAGFFAFTGLATDEVLLVKSECAARLGDAQTSISVLNMLLINRYRTGSFQPLIATNSEDALKLVLMERRKELIWRSLRWSDLKRLNALGDNHSVSRVLDGKTYTLPPNSPLYTFPIPDDEINYSGIIQNKR